MRSRERSREGFRVRTGGERGAGRSGSGQVERAEGPGSRTGQKDLAGQVGRWSRQAGEVANIRASKRSSI